MNDQITMQAKVVSQATPNAGQVMGLLALFNDDGSPREVPDQAAAQTDVGAVTSVVAAGATPTKAEYDALRVDVLAIRTVVNSLLAKLRTAGVIAP
jgi:hypothetical protein